MKNTLRLAVRRRILLSLVAIVLSSCIPNPVEEKRSDAFKQYEIIVRWSQWDAAANFISAEYQKEHPITRLELDRLRLFKVTAYNVRSTGTLDNGMTALQTVEIKMFNKTQGLERTIIDDQEWRYNEEIKRWMLHSSLPDPTKRY